METSLTKTSRTDRVLPPKAPGLPLLGSAREMLSDPLEFFVQNYLKLGPVFRVQAFNRHMTVLAGPEVNTFFVREADKLLGSNDLFGGIAQETNTGVNLAAMDGERHKWWRRIMRPGYSREAFLCQIPSVVATIRATTQNWQIGEPFAVVPQFRRLITRELGPAIVQAESGQYFDDIWHFFNIMMQVLAMKTRPRLLLYTPAYRRAKMRAFDFARQTLDWHRATPLTERYSDLLDDMMAAQDIDGQKVSQDDLLAAALGPFFAGLDTVANTSSFMLYSLLKYPQVLQRVQAEVDEYLTSDSPDPAVFKQMPALHATALETLRRYPVAYTLPRVVLEPFEFGGYRFEQGETVYIATTLTHFLPAYFPEPYRFDIDRHLPPREEHKQPGKFAPYGLGAHTCLGAGTAEIQIMLTLGTILRTVRLELEPADYELKYVYTPLPCPEPRFRVKVVERRA